MIKIQFRKFKDRRNENGISINWHSEPTKMVAVYAKQWPEGYNALFFIGTTQICLVRIV